MALPSQVMHSTTALLYVVGTQKNCLNETVLLSTLTYIKTNRLENIDNFTLKNLVKY